MSKATRLRWIGGGVLFVNLWIIGAYNLTGLPVLLLTFGFAIFYELVVVRRHSNSESVELASEVPHVESTLRTPNRTEIRTSPDDFKAATKSHAQPDFADTDPNERALPGNLRTIAQEEQVYAQVAKEIESGMVDKGLWTRLLAQADGDEKRTKVLYIKQRAERLFALASKRPVPSRPAAAIEVEQDQLVAEVKPATTGMSSAAWVLIIVGGVMGLGILLAVVLPAVKNVATSKMAEPIDWTKGVITPPPYVQPDSAPAKSGAFGENDKIVSGPDLDKGTIAPPTPTNNQLRQPQARESWNAKALDLMARVKRGEILTIEGLTSRTAPVYGDEWSSNDTLMLESSQTWWISPTENVGSIFIHLQNQTVKDLSGAALEYRGRPCEESAVVNTFYLTLPSPIRPGGQAVVNLRTDFPLEAKGTTCLEIKRAWK